MNDCCNGNCNQGRGCQELDGSGVVWGVLGGLAIWLAGITAYLVVVSPWK